jgi:hypothetical protein
VRKPTLSCSACEAPMWAGKGSKSDGTQMCQPCRRAKPKDFRACRDCGAEFAWSKESRCNTCRHVRAKKISVSAGRVCTECDRPVIAKGLCSNHYSQVHREKHGRVYPGGKQKLPPRPCGICNEPVVRAFESSSIAMHKECRATNPGKAARLKRGGVSKQRRAAEMRAAKAAAGTSGGGRVYIAGGCSWCGKYVVALGRHCSDKCKTSAGLKRRSSGNTFKISPKNRREIYERDGWTCKLCSYPVSPDEHYLSDFAASLDHIIPQALQLVPDHSAANLRLVHRWCNSSRGDGSNMSDEEFQRRVLVKFGGLSLAA